MVEFRVVEKFHENNCCKFLGKKKCIFLVQKNRSVFFRQFYKKNYKLRKILFFKLTNLKWENLLKMKIKESGIKKKWQIMKWNLKKRKFCWL